jgi:hypothetical protein
VGRRGRGSFASLIIFLLLAGIKDLNTKFFTDLVFFNYRLLVKLFGKPETDCTTCFGLKFEFDRIFPISDQTEPVNRDRTPAVLAFRLVKITLWGTRALLASSSLLEIIYRREQIRTCCTLYIAPMKDIRFSRVKVKHQRSDWSRNLTKFAEASCGDFFIF